MVWTIECFFSRTVLYVVHCKLAIAMWRTRSEERVVSIKIQENRFNSLPQSSTTHYCLYIHSTTGRLRVHRCPSRQTAAQPARAAALLSSSPEVLRLPTAHPIQEVLEDEKTFVAHRRYACAVVTVLEARECHSRASKTVTPVSTK